MQSQFSNSILFFDAIAIAKFTRLSDNKEVCLEMGCCDTTEFRDRISGMTDDEISEYFK